MALNSTGPISLGGDTTGQSVAIELSLSAFAQISINDSTLRNLVNIASGQISLSNFYGASNYIPRAHFVPYGGSAIFSVLNMSTDTNSDQSVVPVRSNTFRGTGGTINSLWAGSWATGNLFTDIYRSDWATSTWQSTAATMPYHTSITYAVSSREKGYHFGGRTNNFNAGTADISSIFEINHTTFAAATIGATLPVASYSQCNSVMRFSTKGYIVGYINNQTWHNIVSRFTFATQTLDASAITFSSLPWGLVDNTTPEWGTNAMDSPTNSYLIGNETEEYGISGNNPYWFNLFRVLRRFSFAAETLTDIGTQTFYHKSYYNIPVSSPTNGYLRGNRGNGPNGTGAFSTGINNAASGGMKLVFSTESWNVADIYISPGAHYIAGGANCYF